MHLNWMSSAKPNFAVSAVKAYIKKDLESRFIEG